MTTITQNKRLADLPDTMIWEITKHLDPKTIISLLPISFHPPGVARDAMFALQAELRYYKEIVVLQSIARETEAERLMVRRSVGERLREVRERLREVRAEMVRREEMRAEAERRAMERAERVRRVEENEAESERRDAMVRDVPTMVEKLPYQMTVKELKVLCKIRGLKGYSKLRKAELISILEQQEP